MLFEDTLKKRQAARNFLDKSVPDDLIKKILELANLSPSAGNLQALRIIVVKDPSLRNKLKAICSGFKNFLIPPPVIFIVCAVPEESAVRYGERGKKLYALQDATIFASYLQLSAVSLGLGTCWVGSFVEEEVIKILDLPENLVPVVMIPVGFSEEEIREKSRKSLKDIIFKEI